MTLLSREKYILGTIFSPFIGHFLVSLTTPYCLGNANLKLPQQDSQRYISTAGTEQSVTSLRCVACADRKTEAISFPLLSLSHLMVRGNSLKKTVRRDYSKVQKCGLSR
jgi:hypothetical protein